MKKLWVPVSALCVVALFCSGLLALEIQVSPRTLVLSSSGGKLTVHTDTPYLPQGNEVYLTVDGAPVEVALVFPDTCGNLVAQCTKAAVKDVIGDFSEKTKNVVVELTANGQTDSEVIRVKK